MSEIAVVEVVDADGRPTKFRSAASAKPFGLPPIAKNELTRMKVGDKVEITRNTLQVVTAVTLPGAAAPAAATVQPPKIQVGQRVDQGPNRPGGRRDGGRPNANQGGGGQAPPQQAHGSFVNPYTLVPAPSRAAGRADPFGDREPVGHAELSENCWSGTIELSITTVTPLLLLDARAARNGSYPIRKDSTGAPVLEWSALKGALRSAFEAVTNSRFGVVSGTHKRRLAIRQNAKGALGMKLGRVESLPAGSNPGVVRVECGLVPQDPIDGLREVLPGVSVPAYRSPGPRAVGGFGDRRSGDEVKAWVRLRKHTGGGADYYFWQACELVGPSDGLTAECPRPLGNLQDVKVKGCVVEAQVRGYLHISGKDFPRKHDERLFIDEVLGSSVPVDLDIASLDLTHDHLAQWDDVLESFRQAHIHDSGGAGLGRHVRHGGARSEIAELSRYDVCFVRLDEEEPDLVAAVFPVMIGREVFPETPRDLLDAEHLPAESFENLSPADRLFGWVSQDGSGPTREVRAYRGHVRGSRASGVQLGTADAEADRGGAIETFTPPVWLRTLGEPKPQQYRFRLLDGGDRSDRPLPSGRERDVGEGYGEDRRLGRTFYWSQAATAKVLGYWAPPRVSGERQGGTVGYDVNQLRVSGSDRFREYLAPIDTSRKTTKAIEGWVNPGVRFTMTLRVENVEESSLGALLWLLSRPDGHHLSLGHGKPLGFGAVRLEADLEASRLAASAQVAAGYASWTADVETASESTLLELVTKADRLLRNPAAGTSESVEAVDRVMQGPSKPHPVHYPRRGRKPVVKSYEWFVDNEKPNLPGRRRALPGVTDPEPGLPYWEA